MAHYWNEEEERRRQREEQRRRKEEEERRRREEARHRAEEERRKREEAQQKADEQQKAAQQRADDHRRQMERQKQQQTKPAQAATDRTAPKSANTFYTNPPSNGIIQPRFNSISAYEDEISKQQKAVDALHHQQFNHMLKDDVKSMNALDAPIKQAEGDIDDLKLEMYEVMGAYERGKRGNQLLKDDKWGGYAPKEDKVTPNKGDMSPVGNVGKPGLDMTNGKPLFAANDTVAHVTGLDDGADSFFGYRPEDYKEPSDALFGKKPRDYEGETGVTNSGGGSPYVLDSVGIDTGGGNGKTSYYGTKMDISDFELGDEATMSMDEATDVLAALVAERDNAQEEGRKNEAIVEFNIFPEKNVYYNNEIENNQAYINGLNKKIDAVNARLGNKYADYKDNMGGIDTENFYKSTTISDAELAEEAIKNSILRNINRNQLQVISCGVDDDLSLTVGEVDEENRTLKFGDLEKLQDTVLRINEKAGIKIPFIGMLMNTFQSILMEATDLLVNGILDDIPTEYVTEAGRYITFDLKVYSEVDNKIFTFKYFRYPSGNKNKNSHVYVMD